MDNFKCGGAIAICDSRRHERMEGAIAVVAALGMAGVTLTSRTQGPRESRGAAHSDRSLARRGTPLWRGGADDDDDDDRRGRIPRTVSAPSPPTETHPTPSVPPLHTLEGTALEDLGRDTRDWSVARQRVAGVVSELGWETWRAPPGVDAAAHAFVAAQFMNKGADAWKDMIHATLMFWLRMDPVRAQVEVDKFRRIFGEKYLEHARSIVLRSRALVRMFYKDELAYADDLFGGPMPWAKLIIVWKSLTQQMRIGVYFAASDSQLAISTLVSIPAITIPTFAYPARLPAYDHSGHSELLERELKLDGRPFQFHDSDMILFPLSEAAVGMPLAIWALERFIWQTHDLQASRIIRASEREMSSAQALIDVARAPNEDARFGAGLVSISDDDAKFACRYLVERTIFVDAYDDAVGVEAGGKPMRVWRGRGHLRDFDEYSRTRLSVPPFERVEEAIRRNGGDVARESVGFDGRMEISARLGALTNILRALIVPKQADSSSQRRLYAMQQSARLKVFLEFLRNPAGRVRTTASLHAGHTFSLSDNDCIELGYGEHREGAKTLPFAPIVQWAVVQPLFFGAE